MAEFYHKLPSEAGSKFWVDFCNPVSLHEHVPKATIPSGFPMPHNTVPMTAFLTLRKLCTMNEDFKKDAKALMKLLPS